MTENDLLATHAQYSSARSADAKAMGYGFDFWMMGWAGAEALTFMHGNVDTTVAVFEKNVGIFEDIKTTKGYSDRDHSKVYQMELMYMMSGTPLACFLMGKMSWE